MGCVPDEILSVTVTSAETLLTTTANEMIKQGMSAFARLRKFDYFSHT
jgi:hypothetical protein